MSSNKETVRKVNDALGQNDTATFLTYCSEDIVWTMVGKPPFKGKAAIEEFLRPMAGNVPPKLTMIDTIEEGDKIASTGNMTMNNADGTAYNGGFCDIYHFRDGKISVITTYIVDL